jgi:tyrosine-protein kinase Etk/Wzc
LIVRVPEVDNLFVLPCGPIPPNPSELLLDPKIEVLFEELKKLFDVLIIDSAPVGMVSDGISLARFCNSTVYMVRHSYTLKKQITLINDLYTQNKLPRLSIVINDIKTNIGYGSYYGYGYGYGYGFGLDKKSKNSYFEMDIKGGNWLKKIFKKK